jgi:hypothetical protein
MKSHPAVIPLIDRLDFDQLLIEGRFGRWSRQASDLHHDGFCILDINEGKIKNDCEHIIEVFSAQLETDLTRWEAGKCGAMRIQDAWRDEPAVRSLALNPLLLDLLRHVYGREPFAFQTLNFAVGSQQPYHSDAVHFHSQPHGFMCGVWIPLADIEPDSGPLIYYPGSHRLPYQSAATLGLTPEQVAAEPHPQRFFEPGWQEDIKRLGLKQQCFLPRTGQVLIWHANLLHGGAPVANRLARRWSQVVHFYFEGCLYTTPMKSFRPDQGGACLRHPVDIASGRTITPSNHNSLLDPPSESKQVCSEHNHPKRLLADALPRRVFHERKRAVVPRGNLELISPSLITGWAYHSPIPLTDVRLICGTKLLASAPIDIERADVNLAIGCYGSYGFELDISDFHPVPQAGERLEVLALTADGNYRFSLRLPGSQSLCTESRLFSALSPEYRGLRGHFDGLSSSGSELAGWCFSPFLDDVFVWLHADGVGARKVLCNSTHPGLHVDENPPKHRFVLPLSEWPEAVGRRIWASFDEEGHLRLPPL